MATDDAPALAAKTLGWCGKSNGYSDREVILWHCILQQECLCNSVIGVRHIADRIVSAVNYVRCILHQECLCKSLLGVKHKVDRIVSAVNAKTVFIISG